MASSESAANAKPNNRWDDFIGPTRTKAAWKPRVVETPLSFLRCSHCGAIYTLQDSGQEITSPGKGRDKINLLPFDLPEQRPVCCGEPMELLPFIEAEDAIDQVEMDYQIVGGVNMNAIRISWDVKDRSYLPRWCTIKTFTGWQTKFITPDKWPPLIFALADEDAFTYCHDNPCHECVFRCKSGFEIYFYAEGLGVIHKSMDRISSIDMKRNV